MAAAATLLVDKPRFYATVGIPTFLRVHKLTGHIDIPEVDLNARLKLRFFVPGAAAGSPGVNIGRTVVKWEAGPVFYEATLTVHSVDAAFIGKGKGVELVVTCDGHSVQVNSGSSVPVLFDSGMFDVCRLLTDDEI